MSPPGSAQTSSMSSPAKLCSWNSTTSLSAGRGVWPTSSHPQKTAAPFASSETDSQVENQRVVVVRQCLHEGGWHTIRDIKSKWIECQLCCSGDRSGTVIRRLRRGQTSLGERSDRRTCTDSSRIYPLSRESLKGLRGRVRERPFDGSRRATGQPFTNVSMRSIASLRSAIPVA